MNNLIYTFHSNFECEEDISKHFPILDTRNVKICKSYTILDKGETFRNSPYSAHTYMIENNQFRLQKSLNTYFLSSTKKSDRRTFPYLFNEKDNDRYAFLHIYEQDIFKMFKIILFFKKYFQRKIRCRLERNIRRKCMNVKRLLMAAKIQNERNFGELLTIKNHLHKLPNELFELLANFL